MDHLSISSSYSSLLSSSISSFPRKPYSMVVVFLISDYVAPPQHYNLLRRRSPSAGPGGLRIISCSSGSTNKAKSKCKWMAGTTSSDDLYKVLGLDNPNKVVRVGPSSSSSDDIKRAYRRMALKYHPDVCYPSMTKEESTRMFLQLNEAYRILSDPISRQEYDNYQFISSFNSLRRHYYSTRNNNNNNNGDHQLQHRQSVKSVWQDQIMELKRRSIGGSGCMPRKEGSWGTRMRAQNRPAPGKSDLT